MENKRATSGVRREVLELLTSDPGSRFYVRQLHRLLGGSVGTLHRELRKLEESGAVSSERVGTLRFYSAGDPGAAGTEHAAPSVGEQARSARTGGRSGASLGHLTSTESIALERAIHAARAVFGPSVKIVVFGSKVRGEAGPESDLDVLLVVREKDHRRIDQLYDLLLDIELDHSAGVSFTILTDDEYAKNEALRSPFVEAVEREGVAV